MAENSDRHELIPIRAEDISPEKMSLVQRQKAEQLYQQLGLDPVVEQVLKEFPTSLSGMDRVTDRFFGPYDIKGRAETVAKVSALVTYAALSTRHEQEMARMGSQVTSLEGERDQVRTNYDSLVQKVADVVGGDYDELKGDYNTLVERLAEVEHLRSQVATLDQERRQLAERIAAVLGEDHTELKANYSKLVEKLTEMENLRAQLTALEKNKAELEQDYQKQLAALKAEHEKECEALKSQAAGLETRVEGLDSEKAGLSSEVEQLKEKLEQLTSKHEQLTQDHRRLKAAAAKVSQSIPYDDVREKLADELYSFLLQDSKVPDMVIDGVGKFIDFRKYLGLAAEEGAKEAGKQAESALRDISAG
ncbi:MAG: hypothetical protein ISS55_00620 [Dehalococcoidales bacterium]|nr:hypothetical protein [Dehalococcoidales bacterium]